LPKARPALRRANEAEAGGAPPKQQAIGSTNCKFDGIRALAIKDGARGCNWFHAMKKKLKRSLPGNRPPRLGILRPMNAWSDGEVVADG